MADGGEGTIEAVLEVCEGEWREKTVVGPLGQPVQAKWGWLENKKSPSLKWLKRAAYS